jgi:hypothetical protein
MDEEGSGREEGLVHDAASGVVRLSEDITPDQWGRQK